MKIEIYEIDDNDPGAQWFWCILAWSPNPTYYRTVGGEEDILPGTEHGGWYNHRCGHRGTFEEAASIAYAEYKVCKAKLEVAEPKYDIREGF